MDLVLASKEAKVCLSVLQAERNDDDVWGALLHRAKDIAAFYININPSISRRAGRQHHRENVEVDTPSDYWKRAVYLPFSRSSCVVSQRAVSETLPGLSGTTSDARELLVLVMILLHFIFVSKRLKFEFQENIQDLTEKSVDDISIYDHCGKDMHLSLDNSNAR